MVDALILAGDKEGYVSVHDRNKAFLKLEGKCLLEYVIEAAARTHYIETVYVVGPLEKLRSRINTSGYEKPVEFLSQSNNVIENILDSYEKIYSWESDRPLLILPSDIPLATSSEIDAFLKGSDFLENDYVMGFQTESALTAFYPTKTQDGIRMSYFYFKQFVGRHNNLHVAWPRRVKNAELVNTTYNLRYQKKIKNYLKWLASIVPSTAGKGKVLKLTVLMQLALIGDYMGVERISKKLRPFIDLREIEACISDALNIRFKVYCMDFWGGLQSMWIMKEIWKSFPGGLMNGSIIKKGRPIFGPALFRIRICKILALSPFTLYLLFLSSLSLSLP